MAQITIWLQFVTENDIKSRENIARARSDKNVNLLFMKSGYIFMRLDIIFRNKLEAIFFRSYFIMYSTRCSTNASRHSLSVPPLYYLVGQQLSSCLPILPKCYVSSVSRRGGKEGTSSSTRAIKQKWKIVVEVSWN